MADTYKFTGKDGVQRSFVGDRPPTPEEMAGIEKAEGGPAKPARTWTDTAVDAIPAVSGAAGGIIGGLGGSVLGMGVGGVPGAVGGAAVGGAGGEALRQLVNRLRGAEAPTSASDAAGDIGKEGAMQAIYELGGQGVSAGLSTAGRAIYRGYLKPSLSGRLLSKATEIVETGIKEGLPVTDAGAAKATQLTTELKGEVERILKTTPGDVDLSTVADRVRQFAKRKYFSPGRPSADFEAAMKVADELDSHASLPTKPGAPVAKTTTSPIVGPNGQPLTSTTMIPGAPVPQTRVSLSKANAIKQGIDETIGETNFGVERGAVKTTQKVARRGMRQAIEAQAPEVGPLNAREGKLIDLANALQKATGREANRNQLFGVPSLMAGASGAAELAAGAGRFGAGAMALATRMGLTPAVATRAAILAAKLGDQMPGTAVADVARIAVQTVSESQK